MLLFFDPFSQNLMVFFLIGRIILNIVPNNEIALTLLYNSLDIYELKNKVYIFEKEALGWMKGYKIRWL